MGYHAGAKPKPAQFLPSGDGISTVIIVQDRKEKIVPLRLIMFPFFKCHG
jgi:hypothetical protein